MQDVNEAKYLVLAGVCAISIAACGNPNESRPQADAERPAAATANQVSKEELVTYLDWAVELRNQMIAAMTEARQKMNDEQALLAMFERRRQEQTAIYAREPFKDTLKGRAIRGVIDALYDSGTYVRDETKLDKLRARDGKELVNSILAHEGLIREKLDPDGPAVWKRALSPAIAQHQAANGAATQQQLIQLYKRYADAKDRERIRSLVYWPTVLQRERDVFNRSLEHDLTFEIQSVTVGPVPQQMTLSYTREGVTYRPTLKPIGTLIVTYAPRGSVKAFTTQYLIGSKAGRYYITLASPAEKS